MKMLIPSLLLLFFLVGCSAHSSNSYEIISANKVDGYDIYEKKHSGLFCNTEYEDIYYSDVEYNYGFSFKGCSADMTFFIKRGTDFVYLQTAIENNYIRLEDLIPELEQRIRHPEEISMKEADYYWLDFHINHQVVYAYSGGTCDQSGSEEFSINGTTYEYHANGCLQDHILYMRISGKYVPISTLLSENKISGTYLIPLLTKVTS